MPNLSANISGGGSFVADSITTTGAVVAGTTVTAGTGLTVSAGNASIPAGSLSARDGVTGQQQAFPDYDITSDNGPFSMVAGKCYGRCLGQAPRDITAGNLFAYIHGTAAVAGGGGASLNWAEIALAYSAVATPFQASLNLTFLAYASVNTEALNAGGGTTMKNKSISGFTLPRDSCIWVLAACSYQTTQMALRYINGSDQLGDVRSRVACQPSLNIGSTLAFTSTAPVAALVPALYLR